MAQNKFANQYERSVEIHKDWKTRLSDLFSPKPENKFTPQPAPQNFGERLKRWFNTGKENFADSMFRKEIEVIRPMRSPLASGSLFKEYTPPVKQTNATFADNTNPIKEPQTTPTSSPTAMPSFAPTGVAKEGVGPAVNDPIAYAGLTQRQPDAQIDPIVKRASQTYQMKPSLIAAMLWQESGYKPDALNIGDIYDKDGNLLAKDARDRGLAQINDYWHPEVTDAQANNPEFAIDWLGKEFQRNLASHGNDINRAIAAHNVGPSGASIVNNDNPSGLGPKGQKYIDNVARNLTPELRKELGIKTTYDSL